MQIMITEEFEENEWKKLTYNQRRQRYAGVDGRASRVRKSVGHARKSVWWMPWH